MLIKKTNIDFLSKTKITTVLSSFIIIMGITSLILNKGPNLSIDFTGGTVIQILFTKDIKINEITNVARNLNKNLPI